jgi:hypothetical protein
VTEGTNMGALLAFVRELSVRRKSLPVGRQCD